MAITTVTDVNACCMGDCGNCIPMLTSNMCCLAVSGACLTGGNTACFTTVNGLVYTAATVTTPCSGLFKVNCETDCVAATNLATAINCDCRAGVFLDVTAAACTATVTVTAMCSGASSNVITLATDCMTRIAITCCETTLTGGNDACTVTVNGLTYTAVCGAGCTACMEFSTDTGNTETATDLTTRITCDTACGTDGDQTATSMCAIVTITTDVPGCMGNCITLVSSCASTLAVSGGGTLTGGVDVDLLTVNGLIYTATCANCNCCGCWDVSCCSCMSATNLATVLEGDTRTGITVPTHGICMATATCNIIALLADPGAAGSEICLSSNDAAALAVSGTFLAGGVGREVIEIDLVAGANGEISMPYFNHPMRDGIFIDHISGCTGRLTFIYE